MLLVEPGMTGATGNLYAGLHEFHDMAFALHLLRQNDLFVDVGANVGSYTVLAASVGAKSIAIEPVKNAFDKLMRNIHLNDISANVNARQIGISSTGGTLKFTNGLDTVNHVVSEHEQNGSNVCEVETETLDNVVTGLNPLLIKIDVEGFEKEVVDGANQALSKKSLLAVIMELNGSGQRYEHTDSDVYSRMVAHGFAAYSYEPYERRLNKLNGKNQSGGNTLFVRDAKAVSERLASAPAFTVLGRSL
jgi:FkbM family methyltransferase